MVDIDSMGLALQLVGGRFSNFLLGKVSLQFKLHGMSIFYDIQMATYFSTGWCYSHMVGYTGSPTYTVYVDVTLTRSKVKVKVTGLLNFRQLAKPCILAVMTAAPLLGFLVNNKLVDTGTNPFTQPWMWTAREHADMLCGMSTTPCFMIICGRSESKKSHNALFSHLTSLALLHYLVK